MAVNEGPKTKSERISDAVDEVGRRLRLMGAPKEKEEQ